MLIVLHQSIIESHHHQDSFLQGAFFIELKLVQASSWYHIYSQQSENQKSHG